MYPKWMKKLFLHFDLWGFCTQFKQSLSQPGIKRILFIFHIISAMIATIVLLNFLIRPTNDILSSVNDAVKLIAMLLLYWLSILELYLKQETQEQFWKIVQNIDEHFCCHRHFHIKTYIFKFIVYFIVVLIIFLNYLKRLIATKKSELYNFCFWYAFVGLFRINQLFYYLFFIEFIKHELKMINHESSEMMCVCKNGKLKNVKLFVRTFQQHRLKWFRKFYGSIYDLCAIINTVFGWSNLVAIILSFQLILNDFNWFYWKVFNLLQIDLIGNFHSTC